MEIVVSNFSEETLTPSIVDFVAGLDADRLPGDVLHECKRSLVDSVGCIVAGGQHNLVATATKALSAFFGPEQASLLGQGRKVDVLHAVLINGTAGASYSFFDNYSAAHLHGGGSHASALLAVAEWKNASGADFLSAYAAGMEVACRLTKAMALPPGEMDLGWSTGGVINGIATALASGKLLGLDRERMIWAVGIAASQAAGMRVEHGTMTASMIYGQAGHVGARAAILAAGGFTSSSKSLTGKFGYASLFSIKPNLPALLEGLGENWEVALCNYKPYPTDIAIHAAIEATLRLKREHGFAGGDIARIHVDGSELATSFCDRPNPANNLEAKFSLHHWVAAAAIHGKAGLDQGKEAVVHDAEIVRLRGLIELSTNREFAWDGSSVAIVLKDGRQLELRIDHCIGSPQCPMSDKDIEEKFVGQASLAIGQERAAALVDACWDVETISNVADLARQAC
jgi:2-methylcitrate dehydratase PrpD